MNFLKFIWHGLRETCELNRSTRGICVLGNVQYQPCLGSICCVHRGQCICHYGKGTHSWLKMYDKVYLAWYFCFDPICKRFSETKKEGRMGLQHDIILKGLSNNSSSYCSPWAGILSYYLASLLFYMYIMYFLSCSYDKSDARKLKKCFIHVLIIIWNRIYCGFINIHGHQFSCK